MFRSVFVSSLLFHVSSFWRFPVYFQCFFLEFCFALVFLELCSFFGFCPLNQFAVSEHTCACVSVLNKFHYTSSVSVSVFLVFLAQNVTLTTSTEYSNMFYFLSPTFTSSSSSGLFKLTALIYIRWNITSTIFDLLWLGFYLTCLDKRFFRIKK